MRALTRHPLINPCWRLAVKLNAAHMHGLTPLFPSVHDRVERVRALSKMMLRSRGDKNWQEQFWGILKAVPGRLDVIEKQIQR